MMAIFKKELAAYMHGVIGWLFMAATIGIFSMYVSVYNMAYGSPYIAYSLDAVLMLFFITVPVLSMRIMAEERRQKTDQLLLTAPLSVGKIVIGKYLALAVIFLIPVVIFCAFPPFLSRYGTVPMAESYIALLAFSLYGLAAIAVGVFLSSLTENQVIAAVVSFGVLFLTYMMQGIESLISTTGNALTKFLGIFDFYSHYSSMVSSMTDVTGNSRLTTVFDITTVIYFVTIIALMLFLTIQVVQKRRYTVSVKEFSKRQAARGAYSTMAVVLAIAFTVLLNWGAGKLPSKYTAIDVTTNQLYGITDQTVALLSGLTEDVDIYVLAAEENTDEVLQRTLKQYEELSDRITVSYIDPTLNPKFASNYTADSISQDSVIVETQKRYKVIDYTKLYETEIDYYTYSQTVTGYDGEGQLTSAIAYCVSDDMPKLYLIAGHNEYSLDSGFTDILEKENFAYETISLLEYDAIPEDAECIFIHAPETDFSADDADKVIDYLNNGGNVIVTTEYAGNELPNFKRILSAFDMTLEDGCIVDNNTGNYYQSPIYLFPNIEYASETSGLTGAYSYVMAPFAQAVIVPEADTDQIEYTRLLTTSEDSVLKSINKEITTFEKEEGELEGPFVIGVKAEKMLDSGSAVLYVFSSAQLFTDTFDSYVSGNNKQLFSNIVGTMTNQEESVSVPVKSYALAWLTIPQRDANLFRSIAIVIIPLVMITVGIIIWIRRRRL